MKKALEYLVKKFARAFDPIVDPLVRRIRSALTRVRNWWRRRRGLPQPPAPAVVSEAELNPSEPILIVPRGAL